MGSLYFKKKKRFLFCTFKFIFVIFFVYLQGTYKRYLRCPAAVTVAHLQKLVRNKYDLSSPYRVEVMFNDKLLMPNLSIMDVAYSFQRKRVSSTTPVAWFLILELSVIYLFIYFISTLITYFPLGIAERAV